MSKRFEYVKYTPESVSKQEAFKAMFEGIEAYALQALPDSRPRSLLLTALEEAYMWTGKAIRDVQIENDLMKITQMPTMGIGASMDNPNKHRPERG